MSTTILIKPGPGTSDDTYIDEANPNTNYGTVVYMDIKTPIPNQKQALINFDLSAIPPNAVILSAKLGLYATVISGDATVKINQAIYPWVASSVTWNTAPYPGANTVSVDLVLNTYVEADVTAFVQEWINKTKENYGFHIYGNPCDTVSHRIGSSEAAATTHRPYLQIVFTSGYFEQGDGHISLLAPFWSNTSGNFVVGVDTNQLMNMYAYNTPPAINNFMEFKAWLRAGTYVFSHLGLKSQNNGIITVSGYEGANSYTFDQYAAGLSYNYIHTQTGLVIATSELKTIRLEVTGKTGVPGNYYMYTTAMALYRTA